MYVGILGIDKGNSPKVWCAVFIFHIQYDLTYLNLWAACAKKIIGSDG